MCLGKLIFLDGEYTKWIEVAIIQKEDWCPTLAFKIKLTDPDNCYLGLYLHSCTIKVIDDDVFPSDKYREAITKDKEGVRSVNAYGLFFEFVKMNFKLKGIYWKSLVTLVFDQLKNANMYLRLTLSAYLVNVVFNIHDESTAAHLLVPNRAATASMIGLLYIIPMMALHLWDHLKIKMDVEGQTRVFLSSCLFRKYLNYSEESRQDVAPAEMQLGLLEECSDLASGYTAMLGMAQMFGKLSIMITFVIIKEPTAIPLVFAMPILMSMFAYWRGSSLAEGRRERDKQEREMIGIIAQTCEKYPTIRHYFRRSAREEMYRRKADEARLSALPMHIAQNNNLYASKWLGPIFIGIYICVGSPLVLAGDLPLGFFLATVSILENMGDLFLDVYESFQKITEIEEPLMVLSIYFNMPSDLRPFKAAAERELEWMQTARSDVMQRPPPPPEAKLMRTDLIPITFDNLSFSYEGTVVCERVSLSVEQGMIVALAGEHGCGKATLLRLIGRIMVPDKGHIFIPPHLRVLFVAQEPVILLDLTLWENLTMGCPDGIDAGLVETILQEMHLDRVLKELEISLAEDSLGPEVTDCSSSTTLLPERSQVKQEKRIGPAESKIKEAKVNKDLASWFDKLNYTEKVKIHLARAFIMDPEIMVMHRPLYHFDEVFSRRILSLIKVHNENRGLCAPRATMHRRRPRTVFLTTDAEWQESGAHIVWRLDPKSKSMTEHKPKAGMMIETLSVPYDEASPGALSPQLSPSTSRGSPQGGGRTGGACANWCFTPRANSRSISDQKLLEKKDGG